MPNSQTHSGESIQTLLKNSVTRLSQTSDTPHLDAEVLLCHCLSKNRSYLRAWLEHHPSEAQSLQFWALIKQRCLGEPIAYLTGQREFWSRAFMVSPDVLIPRPDTELLIELSLQHLPSNQAGKIIDLGTGSGILAITLAAERPLADVIATDISSAALNIAKKNAQQLAVGNLRFLISDWFDAVTESNFDLVISNPPYIAADDPHLQQGDVRFEPESALISGEEGLKDIRLLSEQARNHLKPNGLLLIEHGYNQQTQVQAILQSFNYRQIQTHPDLSGNPRVTSGIWNPA
ncbi:MAG: peptide chain release factor N(5)-glutamine methyltransferase [Methylomonas lenta]|nr:peptide chain release factor N(5)-glutamine methyltransferase [Methylomonas lenta]